MLAHATWLKQKSIAIYVIYEQNVNIGVCPHEEA